MSVGKKIRLIGRRTRPLVILASLAFSAWFFFSVYEGRIDAGVSEPASDADEASKRIRSELRTLLRKTFPNSAARSDENFGLFEWVQDGGPRTKSAWVVLVHGLDEPGDLWTDLAPEVVEAGYRVVEFRYPNDQPIHASSRFFGEELKAMLAVEPSPKSIHLIGHSMGGLVLREFITHPELFPAQAWDSNTPFKTLIQLGTPNHGSWLATYRLPLELRDHLNKNHGFDALLAMVWDGTGEAQIDIKPGSIFLKELNSRPFPKSIHWVGVAGTDSSVNLREVRDWSGWKTSKLPDSLKDLQSTFPELFEGTGDGCVSVDSLSCKDMNAIFLVDADHRGMVRNPRNGTPPAIPIIMEILEKH